MRHKIIAMVFTISLVFDVLARWLDGGEESTTEYHVKFMDNEAWYG